MESTAGFVVGAKEGGEVLREVGVCRICSDEIGLKENGEVFVACNECGFPVCRPCYEYERREGSQTCPQCNRRYKRLKGSPRVDGDEEDEAEQDDSVEDFQNNSRKRAVQDNQAFDTQSLKSEQAHQWRTNVAAYSSFGSVAGKDLEADREMEANMEWRERLEKWKAMQEKRGLTDKEDDDNNDQEIEEDYML